ncbi:hypothetical protein CR513_38617, partial [Mucuna pruriens]
MEATAERVGRPAKETMSTQAFWGYPFKHPPANFQELVVEPFNNTQDPHAHLQIFQTQMYIGGGVTPLAASSSLQTKGESLKSYLTRFNNATIRVDDPDQKFFVETFGKGLRASQFNNALALRQPTNMGEIRALGEKHIEVEEDLADWLEAERQPVALQEMKSGTSRGSKEETGYQIQSRSRDNNPSSLLP